MMIDLDPFKSIQVQMDKGTVNREQREEVFFDFRTDF